MFFFVHILLKYEHILKLKMFQCFLLWFFLPLPLLFFLPFLWRFCSSNLRAFKICSGFFSSFFVLTLSFSFWLCRAQCVFAVVRTEIKQKQHFTVFFEFVFRCAWSNKKSIDRVTYVIDFISLHMYHIRKKIGFMYNDNERIEWIDMHKKFVEQMLRLDSIFFDIRSYINLHFCVCKDSSSLSLSLSFSSTLLFSFHMLYRFVLYVAGIHTPDSVRIFFAFGSCFDKMHSKSFFFYDER